MIRLRPVARLCLLILLGGVGLAGAQSCSAPPAESGLSDAEKLYGFSLIWSEARYNFVYFDQVPEFDWDAAFKEYLPRVLQSKSTFEYYRVLQHMFARLEDGHTTVSPSPRLRSRVNVPPVILDDIEGKAVVVAVSSRLVERVPLGSEVLAVEGKDVETILSESLLPYISASTEHHRRQRAIAGDSAAMSGLLLHGAGELITVSLRSPDGSQDEVELKCDAWGRKDIDYVSVIPFTPVFPAVDANLSTRQLPGDVLYVYVNGFPQDAEGSFLKSFEKLKPELRRAQGVILDFRRNTGGHTLLGLEMMGHFIDEEREVLTVRARDHKSSYYAYAQNGGQYADTYGKIDALFDESVLKISPAEEERFLVPVAILIDHRTFSAAEDTLIAVRGLKRFTLVGRTTGGSSGIPLRIALPGGGNAGICSARHEPIEGPGFIGRGISPDVYVEPTIESIAAGRDLVLEEGLRVLTAQIQDK
ncbi:MAG TPA: S41 family peptidase [Acidobacteriota bacterium]|nr:S41 family peptidase [Acidobacteriota bacterium]